MGAGKAGARGQEAKDWGLGTGAGSKGCPLQPSALPGSWFPGSFILAGAWR